MSFDRLRVRTERSISKLGVERFKTRVVPAGTVCFVCIGATIGKVTMAVAPTLTNQQINSIVVDEEEHESSFVYYLLRHHAPTIRQHAGGAATPLLNKSAFSRIRVPVPPLYIQQRIAAVLLPYDELIDNNLNRIEILEEMATVAFRDLSTEGHTLPLSDICEVVRRHLDPRKHSDEMFDHYSFAAFDDDRLPVRTRGDELMAGKLLLEQDSVLLAKLNPRIPRVWLARPEGDVRSLASSEFLILRPIINVPLSILYLVVSSDDFLAEMRGLAGGTSTSHQRVKPEDIGRVQVRLPDSDALAESVTNMLALSDNLRLTNRNLRKARDLLLRKLISGEIDVSELDIDTSWLAA